MITKNKPRIDKVNYYLDIAETVLERCTCLRRKFGAVIVKNDEIISTGYEAKQMLGRTPSEIHAIRTLKDGDIADFTATQLML